MITKEEIKRRLWDGANELRGSMDASRYKDYMLGLMFYKFLSDKTLETFRNINKMFTESEENLINAYVASKNRLGKELYVLLQRVLGYYVEPQYLYQSWISDINSGDFEVKKVINSLASFERTIAITGDASDFKDLFSSSTIDLSDTALGSNLNERSKNIKALILLFADLNMVALQKGDILGDAYEYLIGQFAIESGKKAGEFYTPRQVSEVMAQIVVKSSDISSLYDATVGSGSLLLTVGRHLDKETQKNLNYYGQEKNTATYNLTRMNLLLHGIRPDKMTIRNADTLSEDWPEDPERPNEGILFDAIVMNPPYSAKNWNKNNLKISDPRFEIAGVMPPDSKGDYAFLLHGLYHLGQKGAMAIVLPHGVLFRGGSEGEIRKRLVDKNLIDTIIGMPSNLFTNTGIPVVIVILKKSRELTAPVLVIDASKGFIKSGKQNILLEKHISKIIDVYVERKEETGYSKLATREDIIKNEYNLNIPRYVEPISGEIPHDVDAHLFGGIPKSNIDSLTVLQEYVPDIISSIVDEIRVDYLVLNTSIEVITEKILTDERIVKIVEELRAETSNYLETWFTKLKAIDGNTNQSEIKGNMLKEIKTILSKYDFISVYDGYQILAEKWISMISEDIEIIAESDFYSAGRLCVPNMVKKGQGDKMREEQDGVRGSIIPNELVAEMLFKNKQVVIEEKRTQILDIDTQITELLEVAKSDGSEEADILEELINESEDGFDKKGLANALKNAIKSSDEYSLLLKVNNLYTDKGKLAKDIKESTKELKNLVEDKLVHLSNDEIDKLMFKKWFGNVTEAVVRLAKEPFNEEIKTLKMLDSRYNDTVTSIDKEIERLEKELSSLFEELVST